MNIGTIVLNVTKSLHDIIAGYQDINTIFLKLENQGFIEKIAKTIADVFQEEQKFTITELQKYHRNIDNNENAIDFKEQYLLNANIFKRNFGIILQNIADQISKSIDEKFDDIQFYSQQKPNRKVSATSATNVQEKKYYTMETTEYEKDKNKGILEPIEESHSADGNSNQISSRNFIQKEEAFNQALGSFRSNETPLFHPQKPYNANQVNSGNNKHEKFSNEIKSPKSATTPQVVSPTNSAKANLQQSREVNTPSEMRNVRRQDVHSARYDTDTSTHKSHSLERITRSQRDKNLTNNSIKSPKNGSPKAFTNQSFNASNGFSQKNQFSVTMSSGIDPSVLDSEFSYSHGPVFPRTKRKLHEDDNKVPGPGFYESEVSENATRKKSPGGSFCKSPKLTYVDYAIKHGAIDPGPIYYPTRHFLSK